MPPDYNKHFFVGHTKPSSYKVDIIYIIPSRIILFDSKVHMMDNRDLYFDIATISQQRQARVWHMQSHLHDVRGGAINDSLPDECVTATSPVVQFHLLLSICIPNASHSCCYWGYGLHCVLVFCIVSIFTDRGIYMMEVSCRANERTSILC